MKQQWNKNEKNKNMSGRRDHDVNIEGRRGTELRSQAWQRGAQAWPTGFGKARQICRLPVRVQKSQGILAHICWVSYLIDSNILKIEYIDQELCCIPCVLYTCSDSEFVLLTWTGITAETCSTKCHVIDASFLAAGVSARVQSTSMHGALAILGMFVCVGWAIGWVKNQVHIKLHVDICIYIYT